MKVLMMSDNDIWDILKILAALLHMGNIKYRAKVVANLDTTEIPDRTNVERVAAILGFDSMALVNALTKKTIFAQGETVVRDKVLLRSRKSKAITIIKVFWQKVSTLNTDQSRDVRDAFAKGIYGHLFVHIVKRINAAILHQENSTVILNEEKCAIGVLDIFGFENFGSNSFEQVKLGNESSGKLPSYNTQKIYSNFSFASIMLMKIFSNFLFVTFSSSSKRSTT